MRFSTLRGTGTRHLGPDLSSHGVCYGDEVLKPAPRFRFLYASSRRRVQQALGIFDRVMIERCNVVRLSQPVAMGIGCDADLVNDATAAVGYDFSLFWKRTQ